MCVTEVSRQVQYEITYVQFRLNEFRCYEAKIEESEKAASRWALSPGHLLQVLCH